MKCKIKLSAIEMDTSIQCRASIITETVTDYAERLTEGDSFPPVILFGDSKRCWIGDGWHRIMAAKQIGSLDIDADLEPGDRVQALQHALGANAVNGLHRTNADKRRCVTIALAEFPDLSSRAIAEMCGVNHEMVDRARPQVADSANSTRTGADGKQYPARRPQIKTPAQEEARYLQSADRHETPSERSKVLRPETDGHKKPPTEPVVKSKIGPPANGMQFVRMAIMDMEQIKENDTERKSAFTEMRRWLDEHE